MRNFILILAAAAMSTLGMGCVSVESISLTSIPARRDAPVRTEKSKIIFLGFNFNNDFVDELVGDLKNQCKDGIVSGILTKDEVVNYFLMIVYSRRVTATGYCQRTGQKT